MIVSPLGLAIGVALLACGGAGWIALKLKRTLLERDEFKNKLSQTQAQIISLKEETEIYLERYKTLTDNLAAAVVVRDRQSKITYCSPYTEVLTGYSLDEIYSTEEDFFLAIAHEEDKEKMRRALKVSSAGEPFQFRYRFYHKSGIEMWAETRTVPVLDPNGNLAFSLSVNLDVTATVRYQNQFEAQNRDLRDFTYMVSHDLKAPIFTIKGMSALIAEELPKEASGECKEALDHIGQAATRLEQLVSGILDYSKLSFQDSSLAPVVLDQVVKEVLSDYQTSLSDEKAEVIIPAELPTVVGEKSHLYRIFSNLLGNAIKYRSTQPLVVEIKERVERNPRYCTITVSDNGLGIPPDKLEQVFRPFQRIHRTGTEGSGVGLASVKKLVEKLGGQVKVESSEGAGSTFVLTLRRQV